MFKIVPQFLILLLLVGCTNYDVTPPDQLALIEVATINAAEQKFYAEFKRYGMFSELGSHKWETATGNTLDRIYYSRYHYRFTLDVDQARYTLRAVPDEDPKVSMPSYYCDETGVVRESWTSAVASKDSPVVKKE